MKEGLIVNEKRQEVEALQTFLLSVSLGLVAGPGLSGEPRTVNHVPKLVELIPPSFLDCGKDRGFLKLQNI